MEFNMFELEKLKILKGYMWLEVVNRRKDNQWPQEKEQKHKQWSTSLTLHKMTKYKATRTPQTGMISSSPER